MKSRFYPFLVGTCLICVLAFSNCTKLNPRLEVTGQVFIVMMSGSNVKLGLVEISAIPEAVIAPFIAEKKASEEVMRASLQLESNDAMKTNKAARGMCAGLAEALRLTMNAYATAPSDSTLSKGKMLDGQRDAKCKDVKRTAMSLARADAIVNHFPTADYYFDGLPNGISKTNTDADGRFSLSLPAGKFALAAHAKRELYQSTEEYFWLIWVSPEKNMSLMLSNNNLMNEQFLDSVVTVKALSLQAILREREKWVEEVFERAEKGSTSR